MAIAVNKNTTQAPMSTLGQTGVQVLKFIDAPRVYVKTADATTNTPVQNYYTKSDGVTPAGFTDLGSVDGKLKITYTKKTKDVKTGIDNYLRASYIDEKGATLECNLSQLDDVVLSNLSGLTASVITAGSIVNFQLGQEDLQILAVMFVVQNKLDSKELQFYNPAAYINFVFADSGDSMVVKMTGTLPFFTAAGQTKESLLSTTVFA